MPEFPWTRRPPAEASVSKNTPSAPESDRVEQVVEGHPSPNKQPGPAPSKSPDSSGTLTPSPRKTRSRKRRARIGVEQEAKAKKRPASKTDKSEATNRSKPGLRKADILKAKEKVTTTETMADAGKLNEGDPSHLAILMRIENRVNGGFSQLEQQLQKSNERQDKTEAKVIELDERISAIEKKSGTGFPAPKPLDEPVGCHTVSHESPEEACFRQLIMGPAKVDENGVAAVRQLASEVLYNIMGFPNRDPFRVKVEGMSMTKRINDQITSEMYAKVTFVDANIRKQVILSQGKLGRANLDVDVRIVVPPSMKRMERAVEKALFFLRTLAKGTTGKRCQTNTDVDREKGVVGMYRWRPDGQAPERWHFVEPFEDMINPELQQFEKFLGKTEEYLKVEWRKLITAGFDPNTGRIQ